MRADLLQLPPSWYLEADADDIIVLRYIDGTIVAKFHARSADLKEIQQAAEETARQTLSQSKQDASSSGATPDRPRMWVQLLGRFQVTCCCGADLRSSNAKAMAILKYLLTHRSSSVTQDYLMGWLWPEVNPDRARWSLNSTIRALRKLLGSCSRLARTSEALVFEDGCYHLSSVVEVLTDVDEFDAHYERGHCLQNESWTVEAATEYNKAVGLYQGDYLGENLNEVWTMIERERLASAYMDILNRLARYYLEDGQRWESIQTCHTLLKKDPCYETAYHLLMECYVRIGLRTRALDQYRLCRHMLRRVHETEPALELQTFYDRIKTE
jgi:two-component SAPR family response regulator